MNIKLKWRDIDEIVEELVEKFPEITIDSIKNISFPKLFNLIHEIEQFNDSKEKCNEKILEAIQSKLLEELK
jgi:FeS assembly protein IscX